MNITTFIWVTKKFHSQYHPLVFYFLSFCSYYQLWMLIFNRINIIIITFWYQYKNLVMFFLVWKSFSIFQLFELILIFLINMIIDEASLSTIIEILLDHFNFKLQYLWTIFKWHNQHLMIFSLLFFAFSLCRKPYLTS